ncbi:ComEC/Rec2 family competence protein [Paenibacillus sp. UNC451MF]|uniref:ComEC/Rec2 family competence protein n=1 Tax=Paenibacillus sp. UNC451MF TaxID=1449063 RepID=UPI000B0A07E0|nr:MBL fold metallo-hydrolase [Paenibacillus sp. UNC451MF]
MNHRGTFGGKSRLRKRLELAGAVLVLLALVGIGWYQWKPIKQAEPAAVSSAAPSTAPAEKLRTDEVFDASRYKGMLTVRYLYLDGDVLMGDSIVIQSPDGKTMLVDAGVKDAGQQVVKYLNKLGINSIDIALNTHPHSDHIGGFASVVNGKEVKEFYMENFPYTNSSYYRRTMEAVNAKKIPVTFLEEGSNFQLGNDVTIEVLSPPKGVLPDAIKSYSAAEINDFALVFKLTYKDTSFLFTADIYKHREIELIGSSVEPKLKSDMMHAPHHGNESTSSSDIFLKTVSPKISVLSQNLFVSPNLMERYKKKGITPYSTGMHGNVLITSDGKSMNVITEREGKRPIKSGKAGTQMDEK